LFSFFNDNNNLDAIFAHGKSSSEVMLLRHCEMTRRDAASPTRDIVHVRKRQQYEVSMRAKSPPALTARRCVR
jgi:hypothetical protein